MKPAFLQPQGKEHPCILVKTGLGFERIVATRIEEVVPHLKAIPSPKGFRGLVVAYGCRDQEEDSKKIEDHVV